MLKKRALFGTILLVSFTAFGEARAAVSAAGSASLGPHSRTITAEYRVDGGDLSRMRSIAAEYSVHERNGDSYYVHVVSDKRAAFEQLVPDAELLETDIDRWMHDGSTPTTYVQGYEDYQEIQAIFAQYEKDMPGVAKVMDLPWMVSQDGQPITVLKLSKNVEEDNSKKPAIVIASAVHGDEWIAGACGIGIVEKLVEAYGNDEKLTKYVDWETLYFIPVASPDSFHIGRMVHGVDPNRQYPYEPSWDQTPPIASTQNIVKFYDQIKPDASFDIHGVQGSIMYPFGHKCSKPDNVAEYQEVAEAMSDAAGGGYITGDICSTIIQASGGSVDAWHELHGTLSLVLEVGASSKKPAESEVPGHVDACAGAAWALLDHMLPAEDPNDSTETGETGDTSDSDTTTETASTGDSASDSANSDDSATSTSEKASDSEDATASTVNDSKSGTQDSVASSDQSSAGSTSSGAGENSSSQGCRAGAVPGKWTFFSGIMLLSVFGFRRRR